MGRKKVEDSSNINRIKDATKDSGASPRLISLWLDVVYTTVSSWNSNTSQPNHENLDQIGELLEIDNRDLFESQGRKNTGFAKALQQEFRRLHKDEKMPYEVKKIDAKTGKTINVNNTELMQALKDFAEKYEKKKE